MPGKNHSCARTTTEWVAWAKSEGFEDIEEKCGETTKLGKVCHFPMASQLGPLFMQVYCTLCCVWMDAKASTLKQHCVEYQVGSGEAKKMVQSKHAQKVAKRKERTGEPRPDTNLNPVINITVAPPAPPVPERVFAISFPVFISFFHLQGLNHQQKSHARICQLGWPHARAMTSF